MKEYKFLVPDTSDIEVGDIVEFKGVRHVLTDNGLCGNCSLYAECGTAYLCGNIRSASFKIEST